MEMSKLHVKTGDTVVLLTGKDEYKRMKSGKDEYKGARRTGKVLETSPKEGKVIVEGFNMVTKHMKPNRANQAGGIVIVEAPILACKVQVVCPQCGKPTRTGRAADKDGDKKRVCKKCGETF